LGWRILENPTDQTSKDKHIKNAKTLGLVIKGTPSKIKAIKDTDLNDLESELQKAPVSDKEIRKSLLIEEIKDRNINLSRPLKNLNVTICNILNSKGLGADVVFVIGFDQGKFPSKTTPERGHWASCMFLLHTEK